MDDMIFTRTSLPFLITVIKKGVASPDSEYDVGWREYMEDIEQAKDTFFQQLKGSKTAAGEAVLVEDALDSAESYGFVLGGGSWDAAAERDVCNN